MIIPIKCFTCGKQIGHLYDEYKEQVKKGEDKKKILNNLGIERYCCRRMFLSHVDLIDEITQY